MSGLHIPEGAEMIWPITDHEFDPIPGTDECDYCGAHGADHGELEPGEEFSDDRMHDWHAENFDNDDKD
jgi:hypothetical protein